MIVNNLLFLDRLVTDITKEVNFNILESSAKNKYTIGYALGLSPVDEIINLEYKYLLEAEKDDIEAIFKQQSTGNFVGYQPPNEGAVRVFYPPQTWEIESHDDRRGVDTTLRYSITFSLKNYYG